MTISGFSPITTGLVPSGVSLAGSNPLLAAGSVGGQVPSAAQLAALSGVGEQGGIGTRLVSAMRAAIGELRGPSASDTQLRNQVLAMEAQAPVALAPKPTSGVGAGTASAPAVRHAKTWKTLASTPRPAANPVTGAAGAAMTPGSGLPMTQLPANATQMPGATVYSYDANGQPVMAPTMSQLGVTPTMLQGLTGAVQAADPAGPQVNATNQTILNGSGVAPGGFGVATPVPVLGAPIAMPTTGAPTPEVPGDTPPTTPHNGPGATQAVTNRNASDIDALNHGAAGFGWGSGYGSPWDPTGGVATPYAPYGPSMTGAYLGGQGQGLLGRLFG